jgi:hypothetical protein
MTESHQSPATTIRTVTVFDELTLEPITVVVEVFSNQRFLTMRIMNHAGHSVSKLEVSGADAAKVADVISPQKSFSVRSVPRRLHIAR